MGLSNPQGQRTQRPIPPPGLHPAICYAIIDLGVHEDTWKGAVKRNNKVRFCFEFPTLPEQVFDETKGPQRLSVIQDYNVHSDVKSNFMKALTQWRGAPPDLTQLSVYVGQSCQLMIEHKAKEGINYANIMSSGTMVMPATVLDASGQAQRTSYGQPKNQTIFFDLDKFSWSAFHSLWGFVQNKIKSSLDWNSIIAKYGPEPQQNTQVQTQQFQQPVQQQAQQIQQPVYTQPQQQNAFGNHQSAVQQQVESMPQSTGIVVGNGQAPAF
jgi:hypothetical protein